MEEKKRERKREREREREREEREREREREKRMRNPVFKLLNESKQFESQLSNVGDSRRVGYSDGGPRPASNGYCFKFFLFPTSLPRVRYLKSGSRYFLLFFNSAIFIKLNPGC